MVRNSDRAYAAATIDSEGSIGIYRTKNTNSFKARVRIKMNDPQGIKFIQSKFGGRYYLESVKDKVNSHIHCLSFETKSEIHHLWKNCKKFLQVKVLQFETVIKFLNLREKSNKLRKSGNKNIHLQYFNLAKRCQSLKNKFWMKDHVIIPKISSA